MSPAINELPEVQQLILIALRREKLTLHRLAISLPELGLDETALLSHLASLAEMEFVACEQEPDGEAWALTNKGRIAAELLWFEREYGDTAKLARVLGRP